MSYELAEKYEDEELFEKAYEEYKKIYEKRPGLQILERLGHISMILDKKTDAALYYSKILELDATNEMAYEQLMDVYISLDKYKYYVYRGNLHTIQHKISHAISDFKKALPHAKEDGEIVSARFVLATLYEQEGKAQLAIEEYLRVLDYENTNEIVYLKLAKLYAQDDLITSSIDVLERALANGFDSDNIKEALAECYLKVGDPQKSGELTKNELVKARSLMDEGKMEEAHDLLEAVRENYKKSGKFHALMAQYYYTNADYEKSLECVLEYEKYEKNSPLTYQMRALVYEELGDEFQAHLNWGKYNLVRGDKDIALNEYLLAYGENDTDLDLIRSTAALLDEMNDQNHAAELYERLCELEPTNKKAIEKLYEFRQSIGDYAGAAQYLEQLYALDTHCARTMRNLGKIYEKMKMRDKSLEFYKKYVAISSSVEDFDLITKKIAKLEDAKPSDDVVQDDGLIGKIMRLISR